MKRVLNYMPPFNSIKKECLNCHKELWIQPSRVNKKYCSFFCRNLYFKINYIGEKASNWKGNKIGYDAIHFWLKKEFGKANKCEYPNCKKLKQVFEWAKLKGKNYERKRENFWMLCVNCHRKYDYNIPWNKGLKLIKA
jgi:hypothetical protein